MRRIDLIGIDEVADGEMKMVFVDGTDQVLVINQGGDFTAVQGVCSHEYFELDKGFLTNGTLTCALHMSRFDLTSGEPIDPPAEDAARGLPGGPRERPGPRSRSRTARWRSASRSRRLIERRRRRPPRRPPPRPAARRW